MSRFIRPDTDVLTLANGDTLIVKRRLNTGETHAMNGAILNGDAQLSQADRAAIAVVLAYLVDWTITDAGRPVVIRDQPAASVRATVDALDYDSFIDIANAIGDHVRAQKARRAEEKKTLTGAPESPAIWPSPSVAVGATNG